MAPGNCYPAGLTFKRSCDQPSPARRARIVFHVNDSVVPPFEADSDEARSIADQLATTYSDDILTQYLAKVQSDLGVKINAGALRLATGGGDAY